MAKIVLYSPLPPTLGWNYISAMSECILLELRMGSYHYGNHYGSYDVIILFIIILLIVLLLIRDHLGIVTSLLPRNEGY